MKFHIEKINYHFHTAGNKLREKQQNRPMRNLETCARIIEQRGKDIENLLIVIYVSMRDLSQLPIESPKRPFSRYKTQ